jgi:salicylate hydroxylase
VRLKTGEILHADVIIGADGQRSIIRPVVTEEAEPEAISTGLSLYTGSVSMSEIRKHPSLRRLAEGWSVWLGEGRVVLGYPVRRHQEFAIQVWWEDHTKSAAASRHGAYDPTTSLSSIRYKEGKMDPRLRFLLDKAGAVSRQPYVVMPQLDSWVDESESIVLIGEAAHPQGPGRTYACSLALEDAAILGTLFSRLRSRDQVPTLLYAFQDLHKGRTDAVTAMEIDNAEVMFSNPPGVRDGLVRWSVLPADEPDRQSESGPTDAELVDIMEVWGYFAIDAADEWWVEWGLLRERSHVRK